MNMISRKSAITLFSIYKIALLSQADVENLLFAEYVDEQSGEPIEYKSIYDTDVQDFLIKLHVDTIYSGVSNDYLEHFLMECFNTRFSIIGEEPDLYKCPCCGYLTLPERGQYDICPVCQWEDDGRSEDRLNSYSSVNHATLKEYREFKLKGLLEADNFYKKG
ncbi:hypothetical protein PPV52_004650 [Escherichia coli O103]|mgnify:CR=1 FL=1|uniref:CPCC family cysteine-rich protein n=1 Tax=Escherichia TaxID=561 RepID=UPI0009FA3FA3|nr:MULTISPECIES: CPCC family cysteine-rich protein [Escherichia]EKK9167299.1 hypothetical protein [Escherichia coli O103]EEW2168121.1 hypothetical protein [Escherichia coli]EFC0830118.1 hypothetical protein [Escherichia coli]EFH5866352.1 hypothetical protein [Escherichia coli]EFN4608763.1 hypothetical protein [Escherichia coli]